ncbi:hypothetical protein RRG08_064596 [Elysia crispata]|uniref:Sterile alpha motif domain-containing protein 9-like n=1 Tax=Elysia crispata TaxID=231223 RepID=A0AAE1BB52_9GAST|nr:hypothetical protein RRG08_064596 [Elysia crispata]
MVALLHTLRSKPPEKEAYKFLLQALTENGCEDLAKSIEATPVEGDPTIRAKCDPRSAEDKIRHVLVSYFCTHKGSRTAFSEIESILRKEKVFQGIDEWKREDIVNFVCDVFSVPSETKIVRRKMKNKQVIYIKDLCKRDLSSTSPGSHSSALTHSPGKEKPKHVCKMTCQELRQYLTDILKAEGMGVKLLDDLEANSISGSVFLTLDEKHLEKILSSAKFGERHKLFMIIQELSERPTLQNESLVHLRKFDIEVDYMDKYHIGRCCDTSSCVADKTTHPHRVFNLIDISESQDEVLEFIGSAVVQFASACINERRDGTIYFGISPDASDCHKKGEIVGTEIPKQDIEATIRRYLGKSFESGYRSIIKNTVRDARFVPIIGKGENSKSCWVVEVDIRPSDKMLKDDKIMTYHSLPGFPKPSDQLCLYGFSEDGLPKPLNLEETVHFEKNLYRVVSQRKKDEDDKRFAPPIDLRKKLLNLLTGGCDVMQDNVYPFIMLSPLAPHMDQEYLSENILFVKSLQPDLVLDFDPRGSSNGIYANLDQKQDDSMQVLVPDNFDKKKNLETDLNRFKAGLKDLTRTAWMFCNGYQEMAVEPASCYEWKKKQKEGFRNALQFFIDTFGAERIILILCLFSENYEVMLDASDEAISKLQNSWIVLSDTEKTARHWSESMLQRCTVERKDLQERCIFGLSWFEVNSILLQAAQITTPQTYQLPTSRGALVGVSEKKLKDWCDLDILTAGDLQVDIDKSLHTRKKVEQQFYRGEQAMWLNFWFDGQVLKRDVHYHLMQRVEEALKGTHKEEENTVTVVPILHQPMAGGTTSARQILWEFRNKYKCCLVLTISDTTLDQLDEFRSYRDSTPLPILILIDNEDEEKYIQLRGRLEEKGRKLWRGSGWDDQCHVYCTIILCHRRSSLPKEIKRDQTVLRQELTKRELEWFQHKWEELTKVYTKDKKSNINPKFLISFNILKENFDKDYITKVVREFTDDVHELSEIELLKFISFLNTYDPYFKAVRVSALDKLIKKTSSASLSQIGLRPLQWEAQLSQPVKVLLNLSTNREMHRKPRTYIRVFNKIIAENILDNMKVRLDQKDSSIMQQIVISGVFQNTSEDMPDMRDMRTLINNIVKKREMQDDGKKKHRFSKFVLHVEKHEGAEEALAILEFIFNENEDAFTAQLISRYYITLKNWPKAELYAERATSLYPYSSFLWDTYGQVFKEQLLEMIGNEDFQSSSMDIHKIIEVSRKCVYTFQKEQVVSERETTYDGEINLAGYFGEIRSFELLLRAMKNVPCFSMPASLQEFLVGNSTKSNTQYYFTEEEIEYLKNQFRSSEKAMRKLDDEFLQMKDSFNYDVTLLPQDNNRSDLINLKINLDKHFSTSNPQIPKNIPKPLQYEYRSALIRTCGGSSLNQLLILHSQNKEKEIRQIYHLAIENMREGSSSFHDFRMVLDSATVLMGAKLQPDNLSYKKLLEWSKQLYMKRKVEGYQYLEPYLYYIMYNFPTDNRRKENLCPIVDLKRAIEEWFEAFKQKYPKRNRDDLAYRRKVKTLFFLANGQPLFDIIHQDSLEEMKGSSRQDKWQLPGVREKLQLMKGILLSHGDKIRMQMKNAAGNSFEVDIATSYHPYQRSLNDMELNPAENIPVDTRGDALTTAINTPDA